MCRAACQWCSCYGEQNRLRPSWSLEFGEEVKSLNDQMNQNLVRNCDKEQEGKVHCVYESECQSTGWGQKRLPEEVMSPES